jgi:hypothetical protein
MPGDNKFVKISPKAFEIVRRLGNTAGLVQTICRELDYQNELTTGYIQSNFLSGPGKKDISTLAVVTGLLRKSVRPVVARHVGGGVIVSGIGSNVRYAAAHEFGVDKEVEVKEHTRRNPHGDRFSVAGQEVSRFTALRMGLLSQKQAGRHAVESGKHIFVGRGGRGAKKVKEGGVVTVRAHTMHMRLPARRMFERGIEARLETYGRAISAAIVKDWSGA